MLQPVVKPYDVSHYRMSAPQYSKLVENSESQNLLLLVIACENQHTGSPMNNDYSRNQRRSGISVQLELPYHMCAKRSPLQGNSAFVFTENSRRRQTEQTEKNALPKARRWTPRGPDEGRPKTSNKSCASWLNTFVSDTGRGGNTEYDTQGSNRTCRRPRTLRGR
eukprot:scaffold35521_cov70-Phaeocystis_antarctica.AAC.2